MPRTKPNSPAREIHEDIRALFEEHAESTADKLDGLALLLNDVLRRLDDLEHEARNPAGEWSVT